MWSAAVKCLDTDHLDQDLDVLDQGLDDLKQGLDPDHLDDQQQQQQGFLRRRPSQPGRRSPPLKAD